MNTLFKTIVCCLILAGTALQLKAQTTIIMRRQGNVYILPCKVNGLLLDMLFDTGADDVSISTTEATFMFKNGYLTEKDVVGTQSYRTASGDVSEGTKVVIKSITFAGLELKNVEATIMPNMDAPLLLGQSAIRKLGKIQLDPDNNTLTVFKGNGTYDYSKSNKLNKTGFTPENNDPAPAKSVASAKKSAEGPVAKEVLTLKIDRKGGANASSVAWHPVHKKYYASQAGNESFPMEVFDANGNMVSGDDLETMWDTRGIWYNPNTKTLQVNGYNHAGVAEYRLDENGIPVSAKKMEVNITQPDAQSSAVYDPKNNAIWFYDLSSVSLVRFDMKKASGDEKRVQLYLGAKTKGEATDNQDEIKYNYSENAIVYTGIAKSEIGLLNVKEKQIELYNIATGLMTKVIKLPEDAPVEPLLNFSYCNGIYWLNDRVERVWHGYKG